MSSSFLKYVYPSALLAVVFLIFSLFKRLSCLWTLAGLVFVDAGFGWRRGESLTSSDIEAAAGYGVRLRLPWIGTLGLDAGVPFTDGRTGDRFYVHGALGFSF